MLPPQRSSCPALAHTYPTHSGAPTPPHTARTSTNIPRGLTYVVDGSKQHGSGISHAHERCGCSITVLVLVVSTAAVIILSDTVVTIVAHTSTFHTLRWYARLLAALFHAWLLLLLRLLLLLLLIVVLRRLLLFSS